MVSDFHTRDDFCRNSEDSHILTKNTNKDVGSFPSGIGSLVLLNGDLTKKLLAGFKHAEMLHLVLYGFVLKWGYPKLLDGLHWKVLFKYMIWE